MLSKKQNIEPSIQSLKSWRLLTQRDIVYFYSNFFTTLETKRSLFMVKNATYFSYIARTTVVKEMVLYKVFDFTGWLFKSIPGLKQSSALIG